MELTIKVAIQKEMMTRQAADIAHRMSEFESRVLLKRQNLTVNAKSLSPANKNQVHFSEN